VVAGQHTGHVIHRQLDFPRVVALAALCVAAVHPLAAQQEPERVVRGLEFRGNGSIDDYTLSTVISTSKSSFFATFPLVRWIGLGAKRYFDELEFRRDVVRLILFYRQSGFMNVVVDTTVRRMEHDVFIRFRFYEGEPVRVRTLSVDGVAGIMNEAALARALPLKVGDPFNRFLFQASADTVASWLRNRGYPYAEVLRNFDESVGDLAADIRLEAVPGPRVRFGQILVRGVRHVDTATVLHTISVRAGEAFREDKLYESQRDLYSTGIFRSATVTLQDTTPPASGDSLVPVVVRVAEGARHRVRVGAGYGTQDCFRFQAGWSAFGFLGDARVLDLSARLSKIGVGYPLNAGLDAHTLCGSLHHDTYSDTLNYNVGLTLYQTAFLSPNHDANIGVFAERLSEIRTYARTQVGTNLGVTFNARRRVPLGLSYGYSVGRTSADPASFCSVFSVCDTATQHYLTNRHRFASLSLTAARRTENFILDPTSGGHVGITLLHSSRFLGSDTLYEFNRGELEIARYLPVGRGGVLAGRLHLGLLLPIRGTPAGQSAPFVPPEQRFYAGGPNSVRGYRANELGPLVYVVTDTSNSPTTGRIVQNGDTIYKTARAAAIGGNAIVLANVELRVPGPVFPDRLRVAAFVDVGAVYERQHDFTSFRSLRVTPGVGFRIGTPLGPVRMDVAYNGYDKEPGKLYFQRLPDANNPGQFFELRPSYQQQRPAGFLRRLLVSFAIGQAF
jgi:outer membrane protein insertion porin family